MTVELSIEEKINKMQEEIDSLKKECEYWAVKVNIKMSEKLKIKM